MSSNVSEKINPFQIALKQLEEAANVIGVVITRVFTLTFNASADKCKAAVPLETATAYLLPT